MSLLHAKTFGEGGSYPKTLCGLGEKECRWFTSAAQLVAQRDRDDICEGCFEAAATGPAYLDQT